MILSSVPVTSMRYDCGLTSITLPRKMSTMCMTSARVCWSAVTLISASSRSTWLASVKSMHFDDADQLVELLVDLCQDLIVAARHQRDARHCRIERFGNGQALDVEAAAAEQSRRRARAHRTRFPPGLISYGA